MSSTVVPRALSDRIIARTSTEASGSSPDVGSSRKSTSGSCSTARAMATFCFMPLENPETGSWRRLQSPKPRSSSSAREVQRARGRPCSCAKYSRLASAERRS
ncbi:MAG: hypothetical protein WCJ30_10200 [Deltaproteobacteria bacterium]